MSLTVGSRLGPYSVTAKIGEGGMGEVYRARETKLDRDVALKVVPQAVNPFSSPSLRIPTETRTFRFCRSTRWSTNV